MSYGIAKGMKIKFIAGNGLSLDNVINKFLAKNPMIEVIDIKLHRKEGALIIYRESLAYDIHYPRTYRDIDSVPPPPPPSSLLPREGP